MPFHSIFSSWFNIPTSWLASPEALLINLIIPFFVVTYGIYSLLKGMRIFGYNDGIYVILGALISLVLIAATKAGQIIGVIAIGYIAFATGYHNIFIRLLIFVGYLILVFFLIPFIL